MGHYVFHTFMLFVLHYSDQSSATTEAEVSTSEPVLAPAANKSGKKRATPPPAAASGQNPNSQPPAAAAAASAVSPPSPTPASPASALERLDILISGGAEKPTTPPSENRKATRAAQRAAARQAAGLNKPSSRPAAGEAKGAPPVTTTLSIKGNRCSRNVIYFCPFQFQNGIQPNIVR